LLRDVEEILPNILRYNGSTTMMPRQDFGTIAAGILRIAADTSDANDVTGR
jgi:hypothetical protein